jgi:subtilase family serine protease
MYRLISTALLTAALALGGASAASAQAAPGSTVHRDGNVFHVSLCGDARPNTGFARCHSHVVTDARGNWLSRAAAPNVTPSGFGAGDLRSAYGISTNGSNSVTVAIVDAFGYNNAEGDLNVYRSQFGLGSCTTANGCFKKVNQNGVQGNYPAQNAGWADETALDLDMASAMCPGCKILLVEANNNSFGNLAAAVNTAVNMGALVVSNSYGGGEGGSTPFDPAYEHPGRAITASSGDGGFGVQFPASSPGVIAVGGTHLVHTGSGRGWTETVWGGAGSGCSTVYSKPAWQTGVSDSLCSMRMEADVSAVADPNTGVAVYGPSGFGFRSSWLVFGGTSVAAPLIGGVLGNAGNYAGTGAELTYEVWGGNHAALWDVTSGSNGSCGGTYFCTAGPNYDGPTGLGTPNTNQAF